MPAPFQKKRTIGLPLWSPGSRPWCLRRSLHLSNDCAAASLSAGVSTPAFTLDKLGSDPMTYSVFGGGMNLMAIVVQFAAFSIMLLEGEYGRIVRRRRL